MSMEFGRARTARRVQQLGMALFLLGLLTGFGVPLCRNPRMGLSSHLEGILNGMFLILLGLLWERVRLGVLTRRICLGLAIFGTFTNWAATLLAAAWGAGASMPIAGGTQRATPVQEVIVAVALWSLALSMVVVGLLLVRGLRGRPPTARLGPETGRDHLVSGSGEISPGAAAYPSGGGRS